MIFLFTDFGPYGPYTGQVQAALARAAPAVPVIDLVNDAPVHDPRAAAYLLASLAHGFEKGDVVLGVVDPGVGSSRPGVALSAGGCWYVGPDNGLFNVIAARAAEASWCVLPDPGPAVSPTFHGRDVFAPVAALLAQELPVAGETAVRAHDPVAWPDELYEVIYIDHFGNAVTGIRARAVSRDTVFTVNGHRFEYARTYTEAGPGEGCWYENSNGMVEAAVRDDSAARRLQLATGQAVAAG